jgi:diguanylate cyclase (GGDEF)-like protein
MHETAAAAGVRVQDSVRRLVDGSTPLRSVFQPIVSLADGRALGYEALLRFPGDCGFDGPGAAFRAAMSTSLLVDLEFAALETHLQAAHELPDARLFLNFSAPAFSDPRMDAHALAERVRRAGYAPERIVLEISELIDVPEPADFAGILLPLRRERFQLAVDDFGAGFANVRLLVELGPEFVKTDRTLVTGAWRHPRKRVFLETLGALGRRINCSVVAEGVESSQDLVVVRACGIPAAQGFLVGCPERAAEIQTSAPPAQRTVWFLEPPEERIGGLTVPIEGKSPGSPVGEVIRAFEQQPELTAVPVLDGTRVCGLVTRNLLFAHLGTRYGHSLWSQRPVAEFEAAHSESVDRLPASAAVETAAEVVRRRPPQRRFDPVVVEDETGGYHGLLPVDLLLSEISRLKVEYALQSNPLTGLPGSAAFARAVEARLALGRPFALGWADLDNFKPFNDRYGFGRGDSALLLLAEVLCEHLQRDLGDLVAHPGGDDFAFLVGAECAQVRALEAAQRFSERVATLYDPEDRAQGGIDSVDRRGHSRRFAITSVSIGLVRWSGEPDVDYRRLLEIAAELKSAAKRCPGPAVRVNQRALDSAAGP